MRRTIPKSLLIQCCIVVAIIFLIKRLLVLTCEKRLDFSLSSKETTNDGKLSEKELEKKIEQLVIEINESSSLPLSEQAAWEEGFITFWNNSYSSFDFANHCSADKTSPCFVVFSDHPRDIVEYSLRFVISECEECREIGFFHGEEVREAARNFFGIDINLSLHEGYEKKEDGFYVADEGGRLREVYGYRTAKRISENTVAIISTTDGCKRYWELIENCEDAVPKTGYLFLTIEEENSEFVFKGMLVKTSNATEQR